MRTMKFMLRDFLCLSLVVLVFWLCVDLGGYCPPGFSNGWWWEVGGIGVCWLGIRWTKKGGE